MEFDAIIQGRRSFRKFDPNHEISDAELKKIFEKVSLSPSSFNLQFWRFIVVCDKQRKAELRKAAWGQEHVETASAVVIVAGKLTAYHDAPVIYAPAAESVRKVMLPMIEEFYAGNTRAQKEEAIRSSALAAMTLMYAAYEQGYGSCPMIGFDPVRVAELVGLDEEHIPVMMVVLGKVVGEPVPRGFRWPVEHFVRQETMNGPGLV